ncbi:hypothetical protein [Brevibacterium sp. JSBI002]|uniref:hypothetical protein n=1 Tax=Brevibacterium sp. JSBI002 TaxID=2886045 RepID=UPI0022315F55|nr:hypothetical protein [Brevibacterium sp. JSBI002]UZD62611.1 hypothetical protein LJ362_01700 [Brevibacterium sp. JSBI002]
MKFIRRALVSAVAALALAVAPAVSAEAATGTFDVTKLSAKSLTVSNDACRNIEVDMLHKKSGVRDWDVRTEVYRSGEYIADADYDSDGDSRRTRVEICPADYGLGKYGLGPSIVWANNYDADKFFKRTDYTKSSFYVRGKTYASLSSKRKGSTVTLTSSTKLYNPEKYGKVNYNPKVNFQVKSGSKWKTLKTVSAKKGKAVYKVKSKSKRYYRVTFSQVSWATGATSKSVKR